jgi:hypothetical protein
VHQSISPDRFHSRGRQSCHKGPSQFCYAMVCYAMEFFSEVRIAG